MKQVRFKAVTRTGRHVSGSWFCSQRPNRAQTVAERLLQEKITKFMFVIKDVPEHMTKCAEEN